MKTVYYRVFYHLFIALKRSYREDDKFIAIITSIFISIYLFLNAFEILLLITAITKVKVYHFPLLWLLIILPVFNCVFFLQKKRYLYIKKLFDNEEKKIKAKRRALCVVYIVLSSIAAPALLYLVGSLGLYDYYPK
ncbi:MAG: hypothetical protein J6P73_04120 [Bacteroidales bacterium]|nr:hypothetical protein [Bacteroidales bacterium]